MTYKQFLDRATLQFHQPLGKFSLTVGLDVICYLTYPIDENKMKLAYETYKSKF